MYQALLATKHELKLFSVAPNIFSSNLMLLNIFEHPVPNAYFLFLVQKSLLSNLPNKR